MKILVETKLHKFRGTFQGQDPAGPYPERKLKELEYLEKICEKVGEISVNGNAGILEQLGKMIGTGQPG